MEIIHGVEVGDISTIEILNIMHRYLEDKASQTGRALIYQEDFCDIASKICEDILSHKRHFIKI